MGNILKVRDKEGQRQKSTVYISETGNVRTDVVEHRNGEVGCTNSARVKSL